MYKANILGLSLGSASHAAKRAADIVPILLNKEGNDAHTIAGQVNQALAAYGERNPNVLPSELDDLTVVSKKLYMVFATQNVERAATLLNTLLANYAHAPRLTMHGDTPWHLHVDENDHAPWAEWFAASSTLALATLLAEKQRNPSGLCAEPCGRPFIDLGKGGGRTYCSSKCATRARVATYRSRTRKQQ